MSLTQLLPYVLSILSVLLVACILIQPSEAGMGGAFGGGDGFSSGHHTKRGAEKAIFVATIIIAVLFTATSFALLFI